MERSFRASDLPSLLAVLLRQWTDTVETAPLGMGEHLSATAANAFMGIRRRIVLTPMLEHALMTTREATDAFAVVLDKRRADVTRPRAEALAELGELAGWLREAEANKSTREFGLGW